MTAGWNPDPTGRHQLRYWDGQQWTEHVSDNGATSVDPLQTPAAPVAPTVPTPPVSGPPAMPPGWPPAAAPPAGGGKPKPIVPIAIGAAVAVVVVVLLVVFVGGGDDGGGGSANGTSTVEITATENPTVDLQLSRGDVVRFRAEPGNSSLDPVVQVLVERDVAVASVRENADFFSSFFSDLDDEQAILDDFFSLASGVEGELYQFEYFDVGYAGETEADYFVAPAGGRYVIQISDYETATGPVTLTFETKGGFDPGEFLTGDPDDPFLSDPAFYSDGIPGGGFTTDDFSS